MIARDLYLSGLRGLVSPAIKDELHEPKKVFQKIAGTDSLDFGKRMKNPRWRSILVQGTVDHIVGTALSKTFSLAHIDPYQNTEMIKTVVFPPTHIHLFRALAGWGAP